MIKRLCAAFAIAALPFAAQATTITFDHLNAGDDQGVPVMTFTEAGYTFSLQWGIESGRAGTQGAAIFDTTCAAYGSRGCAADPDLALSASRQGENGVSGNVLILQDGTRNFRRNGSIVIDDTASAGYITMTLLSGPAFQLVGASALDDVELSFSYLSAGGATAAIGTVGATGHANDNATFQTAFSPLGPLINVGDAIRVRYSGSGALDSLVLAPVPLPATGLFLVAGLGGLVAMRRRRKAA